MSMLDLDPKKAVRVLVGKSIREVEMLLIEATLEKVGGNRVKAAGILKVTDRTLRNKLNPKREKSSVNETETVSFSGDIQPQEDSENTININEKPYSTNP